VITLVSEFDGSLHSAIAKTIPDGNPVYSPVNYEIKPCMGCFACWTKTPGVCIIKDDAQKIVKNMIQSDTFVLITPITFGGYGPFVKNVMDRNISIVLPFFQEINGEMHHAPRYQKYPDLIVIGLSNHSNEAEIKTFKEIVKANAINFHLTHFKVIIARNESEIDTQLKTLFLDEKNILEGSNHA